MGEKLGASNFESMPSGAENVQEDIENSSEQQEVLDSKRIVERAENNINDIAEDLAQDLASESNGAVDESEHRELVKQSLASMAKETVTEADNDGIRTPEEQDDVSEVFQTALVFGSMEQGSGTEPKENIITKLHEDETTASDLEDAINNVADAEVILEDGSSLAESAAEILYSAEQESEEGEIEAESETSKNEDSVENLEDLSESDGKLINITAAIMAIYDELPNGPRKVSIDSEKIEELKASLREACGDTDNEIIRDCLDRIEKSEDPINEFHEIVNSEILIQQLSKLGPERVLGAKTDSEVKKAIIEYQLSESDQLKKVLETLPQIADSLGEDFVEKLGSEGVFNLEELCALSNRTDIGNHEESFRAMAASEIIKIVGGDNNRHRMALSEIVEKAPLISGACSSSELADALNNRFSKDALDNEILSQLSMIRKTFGDDVANSAKRMAMQEMESRVSRAADDKMWLEGLSEMYRSDIYESLDLMAESEDEELMRLSADSREKINERIRSMDSDAIMDVCIGNRTRMSVMVGISEAIGDSRADLSEPLDFFMRMHSSTSPELSSYSKALFVQYHKRLKEIGDNQADKELAQEEYERLATVFESNIPTYRKLAKAESIYYRLAIEGTPKNSIFMVEEFLNEFPDISKDKKPNEICEELEKTINLELLTIAVRSNNLQLRNYLINAADAEQQKLGMPEAKAEEVDSVLTDFQDAFGLSEKPEPIEALQIMNNVLAERDRAKRESVIESPPGSGKFILKEPIRARDPKKGFKPDFLDFQFQDGFNCPEALGYGSYSDATSGDADFSASNPDIIERENNGEVIGLGEQLRNSITQGRVDGSDGDGYGRVKAVFRQDERFVAVSSGGENGTTDQEAIYRIITNNGHAQYMGRESTFIGVRTGLGALDVDAFVVHDSNDDQNNDDRQSIKMLKFEIIKSGCYTPIIGQESGEVIFTPQEYDNMRKRVLGGIRAYDYGTGLTANKGELFEGASMSAESLEAMSTVYESTFESSSSLRIEDSVFESLGIEGVNFDSVVESIDENEQETIQINNAIVTKILKAIENSSLGEDTKEAFRRASASLDDTNPFSGMPSAGIFGTGSTSRGVNEPGDGDYDFLISLDGQLLKRDGKDIIGVLNDALQPDGEKVNYNTKGLDIRGLQATTESLGASGFASEVSVDGGVSRKIDIDISLEAKNDRTRLSTNMILGQFYEDLLHSDSETGKQVIANVRLAKVLMKHYKCYKKEGSKGYDYGHGGIGGIGIENLILQNGGSLHDAAQSFVSATRAAFREKVGNDEDVDEMIRQTIESTEKAIDNNQKVPNDTMNLFNYFRNNYFLFDRGQNFPTVEGRINKRDQHETSKGDDGYAFDDLMSGGRFEPGGWLRMYTAFKDVLDAWPEENSQNLSVQNVQ